MRQLEPIAILLWSDTAPALHYFRVPPTGVIIGRELFPQSTDERLSRQHTKVAWDGQQFDVLDLQSRNGTHLGGLPLIEKAAKAMPRSVIRLGRTVVTLALMPMPEEPHQINIVENLVVGPPSMRAWQLATQAIASRQIVSIVGEPGVGKSAYALTIARKSGEPFAVYDPTVHAIAVDRVLGNAQTLVLEQVQHLANSHLGSLRALLVNRPNLRIIATSNRPLTQCPLPTDLTSRFQGEAIVLPPLRDRVEEMATIAKRTINAVVPALQIHPSLLEAALLRPWPMNLHDFVAELQQVAITVSGHGKAIIRGEDLSLDAGHQMLGAPTIAQNAQPTAVNFVRRRLGTKAD